MKTAVITVVIRDSEGLDYQEIVEAKTKKEIEMKLKKKLPGLIKSFHMNNDFLEEEDDEFCKNIAGDIIEDGEVYSPTGYADSGFIQVKFF